jgi:hypothetical protein
LRDRRRSGFSAEPFTGRLFRLVCSARQRKGAHLWCGLIGTQEIEKDILVRRIAGHRRVLGYRLSGPSDGARFGRGRLEIAKELKEIAGEYRIEIVWRPRLGGAFGDYLYFRSTLSWAGRRCIPK